MSELLSLYLSMNDLAYSKLPSIAYKDLLPPGELDEDSIKKENAEEFIRFELAYLQISGVQGKFEAYVATKEHLTRDQEDPLLREIETGMEDHIRSVGRKIQDIEDDDFNKDANAVADDPFHKVTQHTTSLAKTGIAHNNLISALGPPSSAWEYVEAVASITFRNIRMWLWTSTSSRNEFYQGKGNTEGLEQAELARVLYDLLASHQCEACQASQPQALIQLPDWGYSDSRENVFQMFFSNYGSQGYHRVMCCFEKSKPKNIQDNLCKLIKLAKVRKIPLRLHFNHNMLWKNPKTTEWNEFLSDHQIKGQGTDLDSILETGKLRADRQDDSLRTDIKRYRLALRLSSSLYLLLFGPWMQQLLNPSSIQIITKGESDEIEFLDQAYMSCQITPHWNELYSHISPDLEPDIEPDSEQNFPTCLLSLAQLLVDIANGEKSNPPSGPNSNEEWYDSLWDELKRKQSDYVRGDYWKAVTGCLCFRENYESLFYSSPEKGKVHAARQAILEHIVRPLQSNLNTWEQQNLASNGNEQRTLAEDSDSLLATQIRNNERFEVRQSVGTNFHLWSKQDGVFKEIDRPLQDMDCNGYTSRLKRFGIEYVDELVSHCEDNDIEKPICVAIIDTGFFAEKSTMFYDGDDFLKDAELKGRVKEKENFFSKNGEKVDPERTEDTHGHGTLVARLVLEFAPRADIVVAKITDSRRLNATKTEQLVKALKWAGKRADIINLSFSLRKTADADLAKVIGDLVDLDQKLIFAAASNEGPLGFRRWPATAPGVFAIHAINDNFKAPGFELNPCLERKGDNFAVLGSEIQSFWNRKHRSISGTSFASPVAAAIAANVLEIARQTMPERSASRLKEFSAMRKLFREHMSIDNDDGKLHVLVPWRPGLWDGDTMAEKIAETLREVTR